jgi:hypothetical protein
VTWALVTFADGAVSIPHPYVTGHAINLAFLGSNSAGDWAVGDFWGPLGNETRAWLDFLSTGRTSVHATPEQAMLNLRTTYAIERAVATGQAVRAIRCPLLTRSRHRRIQSEVRRKRELIVVAHER